MPRRDAAHLPVYAANSSFASSAKKVSALPTFLSLMPRRYERPRHNAVLRLSRQSLRRRFTRQEIGRARAI